MSNYHYLIPEIEKALGSDTFFEDADKIATRAAYAKTIVEIGKKHGIPLVNVAHAGDGNVHPVLLLDQRDPDQVARALAAGNELLEACIDCGGSVTAEHGIGLEKIDLMDRLFAAEDLRAMAAVRSAFDSSGQLNPGKVLPEGIE